MTERCDRELQNDKLYFTIDYNACVSFQPSVNISLLKLRYIFFQLQAISRLYEQPIEVYQAATPTVNIGEEYKKLPIRLS